MARRRSRRWSQKPALKSQQIFESSCWERIELSLGDPDKLILRLEARFFGGESLAAVTVVAEEDSSNAGFSKRQKTAAVQKLAPSRSRSEIREAPWTAAVFCRFSPSRSDPRRIRAT